MLELLEGQTLNEEIDSKPLPLGRLLDLAIQIADALDAAHRAASSTATSSRRTSSSPSAARRRCSISAWRSSAATAAVDRASRDAATTATEEHATSPGTTLGHDRLHVAGAGARRGAGRAQRSRFRLASCSTRWRPAVAAFARPDDGAGLRRDPEPDADASDARQPGDPAGAGTDHHHKALEKDRELRYGSAADLRADLKRLKRETESGRTLASGSSHPSNAIARRHPASRAGSRSDGWLDRRSRWSSRWRRSRTSAADATRRSDRVRWPCCRSSTPAAIPTPSI